MNRIEQGQHILKMIESVDPEDTDTLDEIDARFWCFLKRFEFISAKRRMFVDFQYRTKHKKRPDIEEAPQHWAPQYTRSLDALHVVLPDDVEFVLQKFNCSDCITFDCKFTAIDFDFYTPELPTMHLAWLYAIIQAYIYMEGDDE